MEHQENYDPKHKASSITSTTSTNSNTSVPSFYSSGRESSVCDFDSPSLQEPPLPSTEEFHFGLSLPPNEKPFDILSTFFDAQQQTPADPTPVYLQHATILPPQQQQTTEETQHVQHSQQPQPLEETPATVPETTNADAGSSEPHLLRKRRQSSCDEDQKEDQQHARELLTEEERRANHIASEQKRRNTIRSGFRELTDIIPTLKNINNSKSTILFKAVEYIRHLDKRNRGLREKLGSLQLRLEVDSYNRRHSQPHQPHHHHHRGSMPTMPTPSSNTQPHHRRNTVEEQPKHLSAWIHHQRQLAELQEQLRYQQELLARHNIPTFFYQQNHQQNQHRPSTSSSAAALVVPVTPTEEKDNMMNAPSLNIPADDDFNRETARREQLLSCQQHFLHSTSASSHKHH
ncbi:hypothetical protein BCR43DRAFT_498155 [Syncephalastrum racemosum]|uniref:BHLH domain-containing protein n=1 Tax=Syncephalastrum racemosum TaxID=13706 RepID=A0A1X2H3D4_SYNRA|nr:hypothetical protein BCR43DRAFT_498155 [Syncephalastrum racemosum]